MNRYRQQVLDARSDIYSLGCVPYECIAGCAPFDDANPFSVLAGHTGGEIKSNANFDGAPARLKQCILKCLQKDPAQRFQNSQQLKKTLESIGHEKPDKRQANALIKMLAKLSALIILLLCIGNALIYNYRLRSYSHENFKAKKPSICPDN